MTKKLYKSRYDCKIDGVCGGIAAYMGVDSTLVRLLWVIFSFIGGSGLLLYIVCALIMPREPDDSYVDYTDSSGRN